MDLGKMQNDISSTWINNWTQGISYIEALLGSRWRYSVEIPLSFTQGG